MLAVHLDKGIVKIRHVPRPRRPEGHALLRLLCAGICNTDLELLRGYYNFRGVPGHEFVGEVVEADSRRLVGRRVVGEICFLAIPRVCNRHRNTKPDQGTQPQCANSHPNPPYLKVPMDG